MKESKFSEEQIAYAPQKTVPKVRFVARPRWKLAPPYTFPQRATSADHFNL